jgi:hypothetical protein
LGAIASVKLYALASQSKAVPGKGAKEAAPAMHATIVEQMARQAIQRVASKHRYA